MKEELLEALEYRYHIHLEGYYNKQRRIYITREAVDKFTIKKLCQILAVDPLWTIHSVSELSSNQAKQIMDKLDITLDTTHEKA